MEAEGGREGRGEGVRESANAGGRAEPVLPVLPLGGVKRLTKLVETNGKEKMCVGKE